MLHKAAKEAFGSLPNGKIPKIKDLNSEYQQLIQEKQKLYAKYRKAKERMKAMENARKNAEMILGKIIVNMMECRNKRSPNAQPPT